VSAEQKARRSAAAAALADYRRDEQNDFGELVWAMWAGRLAAALESTLTVPAGLPPTQLATVLAALEDAATFRAERAKAYCLRCSEHPAGFPVSALSAPGCTSARTRPARYRRTCGHSPSKPRAGELLPNNQPRPGSLPKEETQHVNRSDRRPAKRRGRTPPRR
jgi:hypothetical protein